MAGALTFPNTSPTKVANRNTSSDSAGATAVHDLAEGLVLGVPHSVHATTAPLLWEGGVATFSSCASSWSRPFPVVATINPVGRTASQTFDLETLSTTG